MSAFESKANDLAQRLMAMEQGRSGGHEEPSIALPQPRVNAPPLADHFSPAALLRSFDYGRARKFADWYDGVLRAHHAAADAMTQRTELGDAPSNEMTDLLLQLHRLLLAHPVAMKAAFRALVREGRAHAKTAEGPALRDKLLRSSNMRGASLLFRSLSMGLLTDDGSTVLPSAYVDNMMRLVDEGNVESALASLGLSRTRPKGEES